VDEVGPDVDDLVAGDEVFGLAPFERDGAVTGDTRCGVGIWDDLAGRQWQWPPTARGLAWRGAGCGA